MGAFTDPAARALLSAPETDLGFRVTAADIRAGAPRPAPALLAVPARPHRPDDHLALVRHHRYAQGGSAHPSDPAVRAAAPAELSAGTAMGRMLVALPGAHNAHGGDAVLPAAACRYQAALQPARRPTCWTPCEEFGPTTVLAFAGTYGEMASEDLSARDLSSVQAWYNTGDAAHEAHIRALVGRAAMRTVGKDLQAAPGRRRRLHGRSRLVRDRLLRLPQRAQPGAPPSAPLHRQADELRRGRRARPRTARPLPPGRDRPTRRASPLRSHPVTGTTR